MYKTVSFIIIGGLYTLQYSKSKNIGTTRTVVPESDINESESLNIGTRGSLISESEDSDENNVDEDAGTNDIGLAITRLNQQIIENDRLVKKLEVYL